MRFTLGHHLRLNKEFQSVKVNGTKRVSPFFIIQMLDTTNEFAQEPIRRLGVIASRRVGNAVQRNRAKRLLREIYRLNSDVLPQSCDIVLIARNTIVKSTFDTLQKEYRRLCQRLKQ